MLIGQPSIDPIIARDNAHYEMMRRGCMALGAAIDAYRSNTIHGFTKPDPMWLMPFDKAHRKVGPIHNDNPSWHDREPCISCGVRADRHADGGCKSYRRGRAA